MKILILGLMLASPADRISYAHELCDKQPSLCRFTEKALADGKVTRREHQKLQIEYGWVMKMRVAHGLAVGKYPVDVTPRSPRRVDLFGY